MSKIIQILEIHSNPRKYASRVPSREALQLVAAVGWWTLEWRNSRKSFKYSKISHVLVFHPSTRISSKFSKMIKNLDNHSNTRQSLEYSVIIQKVENQSNSRKPMINQTNQSKSPNSNTSKWSKGSKFIQVLESH